MRFLRSGRSRSRQTPVQSEPTRQAAPPLPAAPLTSIRIGTPRQERDLGRRDVELAYDRVFIPSLVLDHTELMLRQHGMAGEEGLGIWAGTLSGGDSFVSTLVLPRVVGSGRFHGAITPQTAAAVFSELDLLDLVPIAQIHSHPRSAFLSHIDAERPFVAVPGFLSIVVPSFGFVDLADVSLWRAFEFHGRDQWRELGEAERHERLIIDPSIVRID